MAMGDGVDCNSLKYKLNRQELLRLLKKGMPRSSSCVRAGTSYPTLKRWVAEGLRDIEAGDDSTYCAVLVRDIQQAEAECEEQWLDRLQRHAETARETDWRATSWLLERRHARNWRMSKALDHVPPEGDDQAAPDREKQDSVETLQAGLSLLIAEREARGK